VPRLSPAGGSFLPYEVNVVKIGNSGIWDSSLAQSSSPGSGFDLGWIKISIAEGSAIQGLPAIVYTTQSFLSDSASYMVPAFYRSSIP
jgi:hypothetical protein